MIHTYLFGRYQVTLVSRPADDGELPETLARMVTHLDELHGADYYNFGIETLIDGLRSGSRRTTPAECGSSVESGGEGHRTLHDLAPSSQRPQGSR